MKIYTHVEYGWDDAAQQYRMVESRSFDYEGPLALCTGAEEAVAVPAAESAAGKGAADVAAGSGALAAPEAVGSFLSTVPEAIPGTALPIGGSLVDITAPGAVEAATAAGNLLGPGSTSPTLLPGAAPGLAPGEAPIPAPSGPSGPGAAPTGGTAAPRPPVTPTISPTSAPVTGAPVGTSGAPGLPPPPGEPPAVTPPTPGAPPTPPLKNLFQKGVNAITNNPLTAGALGLNVLSQFNAQRQGRTLSDELRKAGAPASKVADTLISEGLSGTPTASTSYDIDQWLKGQMSQINQRYATMGRDPTRDSAAQREIADAQAKAVAMRDAAAQGLITQGLSASGIAQGPATNAALAAAQQDKELAASMGNTLQSLALLQAIEAGKAKP